MRLLDSASNVVIQGTCRDFVRREGEVVGVLEEEGVVVEAEVAVQVDQKGALSVGNLDTFLVNAQKGGGGGRGNFRGGRGSGSSRGFGRGRGRF